MPRKPRIPKGRRGTTHLTPLQEVELLHGELSGSEFASEEDRRAAWEVHRERLMAEGWQGQRPGELPDAWWLYDCPSLQFTVYVNGDEYYTEVEQERKAGCLRRLGLLAKEDEAALQRQLEREPPDHRWWTDPFSRIRDGEETTDCYVMQWTRGPSRHLPPPVPEQVRTNQRLLGYVRAEDEGWTAACAGCEGGVAPKGDDRPAGEGEGAPRFETRHAAAAALAQHWLTTHDRRR